MHQKRFETLEDAIAFARLSADARITRIPDGPGYLLVYSADSSEHGISNMPSERGTVSKTAEDRDSELANELKAAKQRLIQKIDECESLRRQQEGALGSLRQELSSLHQECEKLKREASAARADAARAERQRSEASADYTKLTSEMREIKKTWSYIEADAIERAKAKAIINECRATKGIGTDEWRENK
jgi:chromosome segregation ATPase